MTVNYTSLLGLALPVTGTEAGAWGDVVNNYLTSYLDASVAGTQTITGSQTAVTLAVTNGATLVTVGSGATGSAQFQIITCTGNPASLLTITAPASSRQYIIINSTSTSQSVKIVGAGPTTGVTIVSGEKAHVAWNGSDFVKIATQNGNGDFVTVDTTNLEVTNIKAKDGTASMTLADSTGVVTFSANPVLNAGTANGVPYLNASKVLTTGSALTFDGTNFVNTAGYLGTTQSGATSSYFIAKNSIATSGVVFGAHSSGAGYIDVINNNPLFFAVNDTEAMRLTSTGLGIGTNNPTQKLDVRAAAGGIYLSSTTGTNQVALQTNNSGGDFYFGIDNSAGNNFNTNTAYAGVLWRSGANPICFVNNSTEKMRLDSSGNVGIGTNNPGQKLTVNGVVASIGPATALTASSAFFDYNTTLNLGRFAAVGNTTGTAAPIYFSQYSSNASVGRDAMIIDSSGNLGLGVTPSAWNSSARCLDVLTYGGFFSENGYYGRTGVANNAYLKVGTSDNYLYKVNSSAQLYDQKASTGEHRWFTAPSGTANSTTIVSGNEYTIVTAGGNFTTFGAANNNVGTVFTATSSGTASGGAATQSIVFTQAMTLDASGNLGVGTTSPNFFGSGSKGITVNGSSGSHLEMLVNGASLGFLLANANGLQIQTNSNNPLVFLTNNTERARITSGGTFQTSLDASIYGVTVGRGAGAVATNTAVGASALAANTTGNGATAIGASALAGVNVSAYATAVGYNALNANTSGEANAGFGAYSLFKTTSGAYNTGAGVGALQNNITGANNTAVGYTALINNTASNNTAVGFQAGYSNQTGTYLTLVGYQAGFSNTVNSPQTSIGFQAGYYQTGTVVALGYRAAYGASGTSTGNFNTAIGDLALQANTTASNNTAVGYQALYTKATGSSNTAVGYQAIYTDNGGIYNTALGYQALRSQTAADYNTAIGTFALYSNTTASNNTAVGYQAGYSNQTGINNVFAGYQAGFGTTSNYNVAIGGSSQASSTNSGGANISIGQESLENIGAGGNNTAIGHQSGRYVTTGSNNVALGYFAYRGDGTTAPTGGYNTAIGSGAGSAMTSGSKNTILGGYSGNQYGLDIRTRSNNIVLSDGDGKPIWATYSRAIVEMQPEADQPYGWFRMSNKKVVLGTANGTATLLTVTAYGGNNRVYVRVRYMMTCAVANVGGQAVAYGYMDCQTFTSNGITAFSTENNVAGSMPTVTMSWNTSTGALEVAMTRAYNYQLLSFDVEIIQHDGNAIITMNPQYEVFG